MGKLLWEPSAEHIENANMTKFIKYVNERFELDICTYNELHDWSVENIADFWAAMWSFGDIIHSDGYDDVVVDFDKMPGARWFTGARLNSKRFVISADSPVESVARNLARCGPSLILAAYIAR